MNISTPFYRTPPKPGDVGGVQWRAIASSLLFFIAVNVVVTQALAAHFRYQPALGKPLAVVGRLALYQPFEWAIWMYRFGRIDNPAVAAPFRCAIFGILIGLVLTVMVSVLVNAAITRRLSKGSEDLHGSARFATTEEVAATGTLGAREGVYIGGYHDRPDRVVYLRDNSAEHVLAFAPTGSGKTAGLVIPTALDYRGSMVVYDIKGEVFDMTAGYRSKAGNICLKFAPTEEFSVRWNVLDEVRWGTIRDVSDVQNMAEIICHPDGESSKDPHWDDIASSLAVGVILHEGYKARRDGRSATLRDIALALSPLDMSFVEYLNEMMSFEHDPEGQFSWTLPDGRKPKTHPVVQEKAREMLNRVNKDGPNEEFSGALSTAKKRFTLYSDPLVSRNTSASDFSVDNLVNYERPVTLYLTVPVNDKDRLTPFLRLMLTTIIHRLTETERVYHPNKHQLLFLIDEFPTLKKLNVIASTIPLMRGFGLKAFLIAQGTEQIEAEYGQHESITTNCNIRIAYTPNKKNTAQLLSEMTGITTIEKAHHSYSGSRYGSFKKQMTTHVDYVQRPLMTVDEVLRMKSPVKEGKKIIDPGDMLIFITGHRPIYGRQMLYFFDPVFMERSKIPPPNQLPSLRKPQKEQIVDHLQARAEGTAA